GFLDPPAGELPRAGSQAPGGLHRRAPADRCAARRGAVRPSRTSRAGPTVARPAVATPAVPRPALAQSSPPRPTAAWPGPPRRGPTATSVHRGVAPPRRGPPRRGPPRRGPTAAWPHSSVAPLRPGTSSVEFGGFGGRDTPANSTLE